MVGTDKVKAFALTILLVVDSPNTSAVGQRFSSGFPGIDKKTFTAYYSFNLDEIYQIGARQYDLLQYSPRTRTRSQHRPTSSASTAWLHSGI